jgi:hypothetical protein
MRVETFTRDHVLIVQAAHAMRGDQPDYAKTLLNQADQPLRAAVELVGLLMQERAQIAAAGAS